MVREGEEFKRDDERALSRVRAREALEAYVYSMKRELREPELRGRMEESDLEVVQRELEAAETRLDADTDARDAEPLESQLATLRKAVEPEMAKYRRGGGDGDEMFDSDFFGSPDDHDEL